MTKNTGPLLSFPDAANDYHGAYLNRVAQSLARVTGATLADAGWNDADPGRSAWNGDFALLTHRGDADASLNYANRFALRLWDCSWEQMAGLPSVRTAPPQDIADRDALLRAVARENFVRGYSGRRVSVTGRLFWIQDAIVWRLLDEKAESFGVGAFFRRWRPA